MAYKQTSQAWTQELYGGDIKCLWGDAYDWIWCYLYCFQSDVKLCRQGSQLGGKKFLTRWFDWHPGHLPRWYCYKSFKPSRVKQILKVECIVKAFHSENTSRRFWVLTLSEGRLSIHLGLPLLWIIHACYLFRHLGKSSNFWNHSQNHRQLLHFKFVRWHPRGRRRLQDWCATSFLVCYQTLLLLTYIVS